MENLSCIEAETGSFVGDAMFDRKPVELFENGSDVCMFWGTYDKSGCTVLNTLKFLKEEMLSSFFYLKSVHIL